jgi:D-glycero-D-manno-heptose 1,7-bisphosphate phosphatase
MTTEESERTTPAVFLDRDGTIMHDMDYCADPKKVHVFDGVPDALRRLKQNGYKLVVITNQSGIGRGYFSDTEYRAVEAELARQIGDNVLNATYVCPDKPDATATCRKPSPEMVLKAARDHQIDLSRSFFVGDKAIDVECGRRAGVRTILVQTGYGAGESNCEPDLRARDLCEAAEMIISRSNG